MSLSKEEAHHRADQIIHEAEQASIQARNSQARHVHTPLLLLGNKKFAQLQPYQRLKIINQARDLALDNPLFNKALYIYILAALLFLKYMVSTHFIGGIKENYFLVLLGFTLIIFEIYRYCLINRLLS